MKHGNMKHGKARTRTYRIWVNMKARCYDPNGSGYKYYGGRGIRVCDRWIRSFSNFIDDMGCPPKGHSLDRINNNGPYSPENCRWATGKTQHNNTRRNIVVECFGKKLTMAQWAEHIGMNYNTLRYRILYYGWEPERALTESVRKW